MVRLICMCSKNLISYQEKTSRTVIFLLQSIAALLFCTPCSLVFDPCNCLHAVSHHILYSFW